MIELTRINGTKLMLNPDIIETMEQTPDTVITLTNGHKYIVNETTDQICKSIISFRREIYKDLLAIAKN
ncbi:MAG: flagellar FlbD family protein [Bacteroides sp.]|nr:flagellar FlbD family protein [Clostridia bacterium]